MLTITRKLEFDAGHRIPDHKSQCRNLHGHRYTVEITLQGQVIAQEGHSDNGMIMDFSDVKALAKQHLVDVWDHAFLVYQEDTAVRARFSTVGMQSITTVLWPGRDSRNSRTTVSLE